MHRARRRSGGGFGGGDGGIHAAAIGEVDAARSGRACLHGLTREPIADLVRWHGDVGTADVLIVELPPRMRSVQWIAPDSPQPYGPEATFRARQLATPYVVLKASFRRRRVLHRAEVFYRNAPLADCSGPGGELFWPNLLNVSPDAHGCTSWLCTQFLDMEHRPAGITAGAERRGASSLGRAVQSVERGPRRHYDVQQGRRRADRSAGHRRRSLGSEMVRDPRFVLDVPWRSTGLDVQKLILAELACQQIAAYPDTASAVANLLLRCKTPTTGHERDED